MNRIACLIAIPFLFAADVSSAASPVELEMSFTEAGAYAYDSTFGVGNEIDERSAVFAEAMQGVSFAQMDFVQGIGKLYTADPTGTGVHGGQASVGFFFSIRNPGDVPITFEAGSIRVDVHATLSHELGSTPTDQTQIIAGGFFRVGGLVSSAGQSLFNLTHFASTANPDGVLLPGGNTTTGSAMLDVREKTAAALDYSMSFLELTVAPGGRADFEFEFAGSTIVSEDSHAAVDALSTVGLHMSLPAGVTLAGAPTFAWVSAVPEPSTYAFWISGLALLAAGMRRRMQRS